MKYVEIMAGAGSVDIDSDSARQAKAIDYKPGIPRQDGMQRICTLNVPGAWQAVKLRD